MTHPPLTRRDFCRDTTAAVVGAASAGWLRADEQKERPFELKYILASSMYGTKPLDEVLGQVKASGSRFIDIWPQRHANQREQIEQMGHNRFRELLDEHDVRLGMTTRYDLGPFALSDEMAFLERFRGRLIVSGAKSGEGDTLREQVKSFIGKLAPHVAAAEEHGITIGIENHSGTLLKSPDAIRWFAEFAGSPRLGVALAPYHLPQNPELLAELIADLGQRLVHFYAWQHGMGCMQKLPKEQEMLQLPGYGELDFAPLLAALKSINYAGWTEVFMHPVPRGIPILPETGQVTAAINKSRRYLQERLDASQVPADRSSRR